MILYKVILVPHAGTLGGDHALEHAINLAKQNNAKIILLHIIEEIQYPPSFAISSSEREKLLKSIRHANKSIKKEMDAKMEEKSNKCKKFNIETKVITTIGDAAKIILDTIEKEKVDLAVMAKRRKLKGIKKLLSLGSVSRKVVENTTCPILLVDIEKK